jgi:hypothetical protein
MVDNFFKPLSVLIEIIPFLNYTRNKAMKKTFDREFFSICNINILNKQIDQNKVYKKCPKTK